MKTITEITKNLDPARARVVRSAIRRIGKDSIQDVVNHGADAGYSGFTYYKDTCAFYVAHRKAINDWVKEMAEELGEEPVKMVSGFRCLNGENFTEEIGACIYGGKLTEETTMIENALAWFALEESCRMFEE